MNKTFGKELHLRGVPLDLVFDIERELIVRRKNENISKNVFLRELIQIGIRAYKQGKKRTRGRIVPEGIVDPDMEERYGI